MSQPSLSFFAAKGAPAQRIVFDRMLRQDSIQVIHAQIHRNWFREAKNPALKIAIPLGSASIQASWQTAGGFQKQQHVSTGHISIMPPGMPYETHWQRQAEILILSPQPPLMSAVAAALGVSDRLEVVENWAAEDPFLQQMGQSLRAELQMGMPAPLYLDGLATVMATHLLRRYSAALPVVKLAGDRLSPVQLKRVLSYIDRHLDTSLTLATLAAVANMNLYRFARAFRQTTGRSPHQYVLQRRIAQAKLLLKDPALTIEHISYQLGFSSQSHFTTTFRRSVGITPKAFREAQ